MADLAEGYSNGDDEYAATQIKQLFHPRAAGKQPSAAMEYMAEATRRMAAVSSTYSVPLSMPSVRSSVEAQNGPDMSMTREELMAHLDAQQARTEAMLARQNADTVGHLARFEAQIDRGLAQMQVDRQDQRDEARTVRWTVISSTLAIFLALVGTVAAIVSLNSSVVGNVITAFQAGQSTPTKTPDGAATAQPPLSAQK